MCGEDTPDHIFIDGGSEGSVVERLGARWRVRLITRSCCFINTLSATAVRIPPGFSNVAIVVNRSATSTSISFLAEKGGAGRLPEQPCLSHRLEAIITNSPGTVQVVCYG